VIESDIKQAGISQNEHNLEELKRIDRQACEEGERVLFVPTFYAWGIVA
jgi:hypothetical protein